MSVIDEYLKDIEPTKRKELERIRKIAKKLVPTCEEVISYRMPTLTYLGKPFLGFDARVNHIGIYPYSGNTIEVLEPYLSAFPHSKGAIRVSLDTQISKADLAMIIHQRISEIKQKS